MTDNNEEMITISREYFDELVEDQKFLNALRACGVDNWDYYGDAQDMCYGGD